MNMKKRISLKASLKKFLNELRGYGIKIQLIREDPKESKRFEELDSEIIFNHLVRVLPGSMLSVHCGCEEFYEDSEDDDFD
jgi:hypothetical protein